MPVHQQGEDEAGFAGVGYTAQEMHTADGENVIYKALGHLSSIALFCGACQS